MTVVMRKCCACGTLHPPDYVKGKCSSCGKSLFNCEIVYGNTVQGVPDRAPHNPEGQPGEQDGTTVPATSAAIPGSAQGESPRTPSSCRCKNPLGIAGEECESCGGRIPVADSATRPARTDSPPSAPRQETTLVLPGGLQVAINGGLVLGRDPSVVSPDLANSLATFKGVSRRHAWLCDDGNQILVLDLASLNGTWVGSKRLEPYVLHRVLSGNLPVEMRLGAGLNLRIEARRIR